MKPHTLFLVALCSLVIDLAILAALVLIYLRVDGQREVTANLRITTARPSPPVIQTP